MSKIEASRLRSPLIFLLFSFLILYILVLLDLKHKFSFLNVKKQSFIPTSYDKSATAILTGFALCGKVSTF